MTGLPDSHQIFDALGDPTRQRLVDWLVQEGSGTATAFADRLPISRQAVSRHLSELERAGLVRSQKIGREAVFRPEPATLDIAVAWLVERSRQWSDTLESLARHVEEADPE